jgi:hypothetical protein
MELGSYLSYPSLPTGCEPKRGIEQLDNEESRGGGRCGGRCCRQDDLSLTATAPAGPDVILRGRGSGNPSPQCRNTCDWF